METDNEIAIKCVVICYRAIRNEYRVSYVFSKDDKQMSFPKSIIKTSATAASIFFFFSELGIESQHHYSSP